MPATAAGTCLYEKMLLIRRFEVRAGELYRAGEMPGFIHLYVGEEAVAAGVCATVGHACVARPGWACRFRQCREAGVGGACLCAGCIGSLA